MNIEAIKEVLGNHYLEPILEHLDNEGFKNTLGNPLSKKVVFNIIHGNKKDLEITEAIVKFVVAKRKKKEKLLSKLN